MGFFRFFLAIMVLVSHMNIALAGLNPGVVSVVIFYLLAGQVVCRLWQRQAHLPIGKRIWWFYQDRLWRIAPMYVFVMAFGFLSWLAGAQSYFLSAAPEASDWLNNLFVVPLNYYMFNGADKFTLLPPAWSLAAELQFYLLVPMLFGSRYLLALAWLGSVVVFVLAQTQVLNTDVFGYRVLAGIGFVFICGGWLEKSALWNRLSLGSRGVAMLWLGMGLYVALLLQNPSLQQPFNLEVALGFLIGVPSIILLSLWHPKGQLYKAQRLAGALSYGVFLAHFPVMWMLELWLPALAGNVVAVSIGSIAVALAGHYGVERPLWARHRAMLASSGREPIQQKAV